MAYRFSLDGVLFPVVPSKLDMKINNQNKTITLINDGEVNILKKAGLSDIDFEVLLPNVKYPFAIYEDGFKGSAYYTDKLESLKLANQPFDFIVTRAFPNGKQIFDINKLVSLEDYKIKEDSKNGFDLLVSISLKEYRENKTVVSNVIIEDGKAKVTIENARETKNSPKPKSTENYTVVKGDTLWSIAKRVYGDGNLYAKLAELNNINDPNNIKIGAVLTLPNGGLV